MKVVFFVVFWRNERTITRAILVAHNHRGKTKMISDVFIKLKSRSCLSRLALFYKQICKLLLKVQSDCSVSLELHYLLRFILLCIMLSRGFEQGIDKDRLNANYNNNKGNYPHI